MCTVHWARACVCVCVSWNLFKHRIHISLSLSLSPSLSLSLYLYPPPSVSLSLSWAQKGPFSVENANNIMRTRRFFPGNVVGSPEWGGIRLAVRDYIRAIKRDCESEILPSAGPYSICVRNILISDRYYIFYYYYYIYFLLPDIRWRSKRVGVFIIPLIYIFPSSTERLFW